MVSFEEGAACHPCHIEVVWRMVSVRPHLVRSVVAVRFRDSHAHCIASAQSLRLVGTLISG